ncbi:hypothetical protein ACQ26G_004393 [Yersinia enterocolitica]|nr:hypothetical protein [Yersinia enterocolitica]HEI6831940.1 hypothetical protein [Yersinia enterocolitica]
MDTNLKHFFNHLVASEALVNYKAGFKVGEFDSLKLVYKSDYRNRPNYRLYNFSNENVKHYIKTLGFVIDSSNQDYRLKEHRIDITIDFYYEKILPTLCSTPPYVTFDDVIRRIYLEKGIIPKGILKN